MNWLAHLTKLYGRRTATDIQARVSTLLADYRSQISPRPGELTERDALLITYGDQVQTQDEKPLQTLAQICHTYLSDVVSEVHLLPFYPWTSDDGFSVTDYVTIDPALGQWSDLNHFQPKFKLMFDGVINHISAHSAWFQAFLQDDWRYRDYFIVVANDPDLSLVVRPRALPLLTAFVTPSGEKRVWTTFSPDQIDLNYRNPEVLLDILRVLLFYVVQGATFIRLDAIAYLWKEIGTTCIHLPPTHQIIQFLHAALTDVAPQVQLITETNVPHVDNISYFGDGTNEAQLVYNFALPPLTLHTLRTGNAQALSHWAATLTRPSDQATFFNFLASHDGIGLNPVRGILAPTDIDALVDQTRAHGGLVSYKHNADGTQSPYELNINYFDALSDPNSQEPLTLQVDRFLAAQAMMLALIGVPGIYFHSLFGSRSWPAGVEHTGRNRTINRQKCARAEFEEELANPDSLRAQVFKRYRQLLDVRSRSAAFHPNGHQQVLDLHPAVFALERQSPDKSTRVLCLHNVSPQIQTLSATFSSASDVLTHEHLQGERLTLTPYQVRWIKLL